MLSTHNHTFCIESALARAEKVCTKQDVRLTPIRRHVLKLLLQDHRPAKAYDLLEKLKDTPYAAKPPTIYRALDFLLEHHLIHKVESLNAFIACSKGGLPHFYQFFICDACGELEEVQENKTSPAARYVSTHQFKIKRQVMEIQGLCHACQ